MSGPTAADILEASKLAIDLVKTIVEAGQNPKTEIQRLIDVRKAVREIDAEAEDDLNKKFGG